MTRDRDRSAPLLVLALAGAAIAGYLALFELGVVASVWDPLFGDGSVRVLESAPARALPVPDALLGLGAYGLEAALLIAARVARPGLAGALRVALGGLAAVMAVAAFGLVGLQAFVVGAWCSLCLASALISWAIALVAIPEALAVLRAPDAAPASDASDAPQSSSRPPAGRAINR